MKKYLYEKILLINIIFLIFVSIYYVNSKDIIEILVTLFFTLTPTLFIYIIFKKYFNKWNLLKKSSKIFILLTFFIAIFIPFFIYIQSFFQLNSDFYEIYGYIPIIGFIFALIPLLIGKYLADKDLKKIN